MSHRLYLQMTADHLQLLLPKASPINLIQAFLSHKNERESRLAFSPPLTLRIRDLQNAAPMARSIVFLERLPMRSNLVFEACKECLISELKFLHIQLSKPMRSKLRGNAPQASEVLSFGIDTCPICAS